MNFNHRLKRLNEMTMYEGQETPSEQASYGSEAEKPYAKPKQPATPPVKLRDPKRLDLGSRLADEFMELKALNGQ